MQPSEDGATGSPEPARPAWPQHVLRAGSTRFETDEEPDPAKLPNVEPWLSALVQAEHLNLLVGSGLTTAIGKVAKAPAVEMKPGAFKCELADAVAAAARESAGACGRGDPNLEDEVRAAIELLAGLRVLARAGDPTGPEQIGTRAQGLLKAWESALDACLTSFLDGVLATERGIRAAVAAGTEDSNRIRRLLGSFLLAFASRTATRERLHIFTTNYDRLIEYGCDGLGLRVLDRFVGGLDPVFRASRLGIDMHYNPPGIRGEPRYLEGVLRLTKLHGSIDWRQRVDLACGRDITRTALPFGAPGQSAGDTKLGGESLIIYPNSAKDVETLEYPYAELFRDFAAAVCQPNAVLVAYGYGFGDEHINRVVRDMLTIPSTHLAVISYDQAAGRVPRFCEGVAREEQITLLVGPTFGDLGQLVEHYLPKPAIDRNTWRMVELINRRKPRAGGDDPLKQDDQRGEP